MNPFNARAEAVMYQAPDAMLGGFVPGMPVPGFLVVQCLWNLRRMPQARLCSGMTGSDWGGSAYTGYAQPIPGRHGASCKGMPVVTLPGRPVAIKCLWLSDSMR